MDGAIENKLKQLGYAYNAQAQGIIRKCMEWYTDDEMEFHARVNVNGVKRDIESLNFAKRGCADDANLCEVVEINAGKNEQTFTEIKKILGDSNFTTQYRKQLELCSAGGTVGCYVRLDNATLLSNGKVRDGKIKLNYCDATEIIPLTTDNDVVTECAFVGTDITKGKETKVLVVFTKDENGMYTADTCHFRNDKLIDEYTLKLGSVKPFSLMRTAEVNNLRNMQGYGLPKVYNAIPVLKVLDLAYFILFGDLDKGEKLVFINELLACIKTDANGERYLTPQQKELFILLGEKLPDQSSVIQEYNPTIRIEDITKVFETALSLFSIMFGYGSKKYTFENGQIKTATEYIGNRQDAMQELKKQRDIAVEYIRDIVKAVEWFSDTFNGTHYQSTEEITVEFDDSYIEDKATELERKRNDALQFGIPKLIIWYLMDAYHLSEEEATSLYTEQVEQTEKQDAEENKPEEE